MAAEFLADAIDNSRRISRRDVLVAGAAAGITGASAWPVRIARAGTEPAYLEVEHGVYLRYGVHEEISAENGGAIANIGFIIGEESVAVVDTGTTPACGRALRLAIESATDKPITHIIATHVHPDHSFGHAAFKDLDPLIIGHRRLRSAMGERGPFYLERFSELSPRFEEIEIIPPSVAVEKTLTIDLGRRELILEAWPAAHTDNDLTVFDQNTNTLWAADLLFVGRIPALDGSLKGWISATTRLETGPKRTIVPGHGPIQTTVSGLRAQKRYLTTLRDRVATAIDDGRDMQDTVSALAEFEPSDWLLFDGYHGRNVINAYTELEWDS